MGEIVMKAVENRKSWLWYFWIASAVITAIGFVGLLVASHYFEDNLLGGWAILFGPIYWIGQVLILVAVVITVIRSLRRRS